MKLIFTGFLQVFFVTINTYLISTKSIYGTALAGFIISFIWSFNVKKVAFGTVEDRIIYSLGAGLGSCFGLLFSIYLIK
jgi:hypothetical protein